jgi:hypothetical protein
MVRLRLVTTLRAGLLALGLAMVVTGCAPAPIRAEDRDSGFLLTISTPRAEWSSHEAISVSAEFSYLGPGTATVTGPGPGRHVAFAVVELTGKREMQPLWLLGCVTWKMTRTPLAYPFQKSVAYSPDEPDASFYEAWADDPKFTLPPGRWEVSALAPFSLGGGCGGHSINLKATVTLTVK